MEKWTLFGRFNARQVQSKPGRFHSHHTKVPPRKGFCFLSQNTVSMTTTRGDLLGSFQAQSVLLMSPKLDDLRAHQKPQPLGDWLY